MHTFYRRDLHTLDRGEGETEVRKCLLTGTSPVLTACCADRQGSRHPLLRLNRLCMPRTAGLIGPFGARMAFLLLAWRSFLTFLCPCSGRRCGSASIEA